MAAVVGVISQKGGVGKSTLARALATVAAKAGLKVKIADLDAQQKTSTEWKLRRERNSIEPHLDVEPFASLDAAMRVAGEYDVLIIDGPARASAGTLEIAKLADLVVQPSGASLDDLQPGVLVFHQLVKGGIDPDKLAFAVCRIGTESEEAEARRYVENAGYVVLDGALLERPAYRQAQDAGYAVIETRFGTLNKRADRLLEALLDRMIAVKDAQEAAVGGRKPGKKKDAA